MEKERIQLSDEMLAQVSGGTAGEIVGDFNALQNMGLLHGEEVLASAVTDTFEKFGVTCELFGDMRSVNRYFIRDTEVTRIEALAHVKAQLGG